MNKFCLISLFLFSLATHTSAQMGVELELVNPGTLPLSIITAGSSFSLNIEIAGPAGTSALDSFDVTLSGSSTGRTALPAGITLTGFSNLNNSFFGGPDTPNNPLSYSALAIMSDVSFSTTTVTILTANFNTSDTLAPGFYEIDFAPAGKLQDLFDSAGNPIIYAPIEALIEVAAVPEPQCLRLILFGFVLLGVRSFFKLRYGETRNFTTPQGPKAGLEIKTTN
jgi:hypothetical protein